MKLDSRILEGKRPLTCIDVEQAREFEGKQCLFSSSFANYKNIREYAKYQQYTGTLSVKDKDKFKYIADEESPYRNENDGYFYELVLPLEWIKEPETPKFLPYTLDTWEQDFKPGDTVLFRDKEDATEYKFVHPGYIKHQNNLISVSFGPYLYTFYDLFNSYEIYRNGTWQPFGIEVKEK